MPRLRFQFDEAKGVEALTYIANQWPRVTAFYASKVLFFAEKYHLNRYARPVVADTFIAMPNGPVPSTLYDFLKGQLGMAGNPEAFQAALDTSSYPHVLAKRAADLDMLSESDLECINDAIAFCRARSFSALSNATHNERAWRDAPLNGAMDYEGMLDVESGNEVLEEAREFAAFGVL